jgi:hypothetical protein
MKRSTKSTIDTAIEKKTIWLIFVDAFHFLPAETILFSRIFEYQDGVLKGTKQHSSACMRLISILDDGWNDICIWSLWKYTQEEPVAITITIEYNLE